MPKVFEHIRLVHTKKTVNPKVSYPSSLRALMLMMDVASQTKKTYDANPSHLQLGAATAIATRTFLKSFNRRCFVWAAKTTQKYLHRRRGWQRTCFLKNQQGTRQSLDRGRHVGGPWPNSPGPNSRSHHCHLQRSVQALGPRLHGLERMRDRRRGVPAGWHELFVLLLTLGPVRWAGAIIG